MSSDIAITVDNVSKCYHIYDRPRDRLLQMLSRGRRAYFREFWALKGISFEVEKGETVGIIGRNGSGKSTLLQIITGTLSPTSGDVTTVGRIAALLELGSGFNPEFTGRENVFMNAALLGLRQHEIEEKFEDIVAFADIGDFIDQPVKTYSSGMTVRLAFAVQAQVEPDILIVDEALSVGDAKFQAKCFERLRQLKSNGTSILLVTHSSEQIVAHCSRALLMNQGQQVEAGDPRRVVNRYMDLLFGKERKAFEAPVQAAEASEPETAAAPFELSATEDIFSSRIGYNPHEYRWGDGSAAILDFHLLADNEPYPVAVTSGQLITLTVAVKFYRTLVRPILGVTIKTKEGVTVYGANSETLECDSFKQAGGAGSVVHATARFRCHLAAGDYFVSLGIATRQGEDIVPHDRRYDSIHLYVRPDARFFGLANLDLSLTSEGI